MRSATATPSSIALCASIGPRTTSPTAQTFAAAAGCPVQFQRQPFAELEARSAETAKMFGWFEAGGYRADLAALRRVSPDLTTLASWLASGSWTPPKS